MNQSTKKIRELIEGRPALIVDFGRELDGSKAIHCLETDAAWYHG